MAILAQAQALGIPAEQLPLLTGGARRAEDRLDIQPGNWPALRVFLAAETQWLRAGMNGMPCGFDLAVIPAVAGMLGIPADADLLARLRVIEGEALSAMIERAG